MEKKPLISVIIPVYNIEDCLERCVMSVVDQTYPNIEIILVDDGSRDSSPAMCDEFAAKYSNVFSYHKENGGSSSARNLGISMAKGEYLGFVDSDDFVEPDMYELLMDGIQRNDLTMAQISRDEIDSEGKKMPDVCVPPTEERMISSEEMLRELLMHTGDCSFCTRLTHKSHFEGKGFPEGKLNEDFYLLIHMLPEVGKLVILPKQTYHVYYRIGSNSRKKDKDEFPQVFTDIVENADFVQKIVEKSYPELEKVSIRFGLYQRLDYLLHIPISKMTKENHFYKNVCRHLRKKFGKMLVNPYLTGKNKIYLFLFTLAPKFVRQVHATIR